MQKICQAPSHVGEHVGIPCKKRRPDTEQHEESGDSYGKPREHDGEVIHLVFKRVFRKAPGRWRGFTAEPLHSVKRIMDVDLIRPDGPEIHEKGGMDEMEQNR